MLVLISSQSANGTNISPRRKNKRVELMGEDARYREHQHEGRSRELQVECKTILAETWLMEVERRMRFLVIENRMTRIAISASTFPGILDGILNATPYLHTGYRCCAACAFAHRSTSFPNWRRGEASAKDNKDNTVCGVMIPYGNCLVNYANTSLLFLNAASTVTPYAWRLTWQ